MTDRHVAYVVVLDGEIREDNAEAIITALRMVKGVIDVQPVVGNLDEQVAESKVDARWRRRLATLLTEPEAVDTIGGRHA